jgi:hypothetical protein
VKEILKPRVQEPIKLVKDFALRRFDFFVDALSRRLEAAGMNLSTEDLIRAYEQILALVRDTIAKQLADVLRHLPANQQQNIISSVRCKIAARTLTLVHALKVKHLE